MDWMRYSAMHIPQSKHLNGNQLKILMPLKYSEEIKVDSGNDLICKDDMLNKCGLGDYTWRK